MTEDNDRDLERSLIPASASNDATRSLGEDRVEPLHASSTNAGVSPPPPPPRAVIYEHGSNPAATRSLLGNSHFYGNSASSTSVRRTLVKWTVRLCSLTTLMIAVILVFAAASGMFKSMDKSPPEVTGNATVIEPNTRYEYPVMIDRHVGGVNPQRIVGLCVWRYTIPIPTHPHVEVATVGLYVDAADGRRRLLKFKNVEDEDIQSAEVLNEIEHELRRIRPLTLRYKMVGNPSSHAKQMLKGWADDLEASWRRMAGSDSNANCLQPKVLDRWKSDFIEHFTPHYFKKGDDFSLEIREDGSTHAYKDGKCLARADVTEVSGSRTGGSYCLGRALIENEIHQRKEGIVNLLKQFLVK